MIQARAAPRRVAMRIVARALACALPLVLAACGRPAAPPAAPPATAPAIAPAIAPAAEQAVVNVLNWPDYIAPGAVASFERETGIKVQYDVFDSNEVLETRLLTGRTGYDVVAPSDFFLERQIPQGVYRPLDKSLLPNYRNLDPQLLAALAAADPGNAYAIPYLWVTSGISFDRAKVRRALGNDAPLDSWALVFEPKYAAHLKNCGLVMLDGPSDVLPSAKLYLGLDPNSEDLKDLEKVEQLLDRVSPYVRYVNSSQYVNDLANGEVCVALGRSGDMLRARARAHEAGTNADIAYVVPKEGALRTIDTLAIPADAPHPRNAHRFLDFIMRPDIAAATTAFRKYATPNAAARALVEPALNDEPALFPRQDVLARLHAHRAESPAYTRYQNRAWARIRTGHEDTQRMNAQPSEHRAVAQPAAKDTP